MANWITMVLAAGLTFAGATVSLPARSGAQGVQLELALADGPSPRAAGELPPLLMRLRNEGPDSVAYVIGLPDIEIDGVWYVQMYAGSCCAGPQLVAPGGRSEWFPFGLVASMTFAAGVAPVRILDLKPGRHSIRVRSVSNASAARFHVRSGASPLVLISNAIGIDVPGPGPLVAMQTLASPACVPEPGRRSTLLHGAVDRADRFVRVTEGGWQLRLEPIEHGWAVHISTPDRPADDFSRLTPPWHSSVNALAIEGWQFRNAVNTGPNDGSVNAPVARRDFIFSPLVGRGIDGGNATSAADMERVQAFGRGWIFIDSYRLTPPRRGGRADFESLTFWACLSWPAG
jgi:hypothetical protein